MDTRAISVIPPIGVVTDIQMPQLDGIGMMQCIRTINPGVRTVYMSGAVDEFRGPLERETKLYDARVLRKPFSRRSLLAQLSTGTRKPSEVVPERCDQKEAR